VVGHKSNATPVATQPGRTCSRQKSRHGHHERTIRELAFTSRGIRIGEPLSDFQGVLTGTPVYGGAEGELLNNVSKR
jgi:circadian clock protein KaiC